MPTTSRSRRAGGTKRIAVLDAVMGVLAARGYENTRFADVSAVSGVAISTLQNYFGSREDMLIETLRRATDQEITAMEATAAAEGAPWQRLVALVDRSLDSPEQTKQVLIEFWRSAMRDEELRAYGREVQARYREPFLSAVADGRGQGTFAPLHDAGEVVDYLLVALAGIMIPRTLHQPDPSAEAFRRILLGQLGALLGRTP
jgi:AcrR family transcriptional regulator